MGTGGMCSDSMRLLECNFYYFIVFQRFKEWLGHLYQEWKESDNHSSCEEIIGEYEYIEIHRNFS